MVENPNSGKACLGLAETFYKAKLFEEAKTMYEWAIKNGENKNEVWNKLNSINQQLDLQENHNSLELSRENELPTIQRAEELINKSDLINAEKILRQIFNSNPNNIDALNDYAVVHIMQNNYQHALEIINKVIQIDPSNEVALDNIKYIEQEVNSIN
ncbi:MAG TPA: tetratricopeptide repeat protein [Ignavibacteria bacterium]|nr:tetratricopeptide repeat protein [Ignavibacteria bacterium]